MRRAPANKLNLTLYRRRAWLPAGTDAALSPRAALRTVSNSKPRRVGAGRLRERQLNETSDVEVGWKLPRSDCRKAPAGQRVA